MMYRHIARAASVTSGDIPFEAGWNRDIRLEYTPTTVPKPTLRGVYPSPLRTVVGLVLIVSKIIDVEDASEY